MREPTIFWGPGLVKPGVVLEMGTTMDLLPTLCQLAAAELPADRVLDGFDLTPTLRGASASAHPRDTVFYYRGTQIYAVRKGPYKAHFVTRSEYGPGTPQTHDPPLLYDLLRDPSEKYDVAAKHPEVIAIIEEVVKEHEKTIKSVPNQLEIPLAKAGEQR
jgi:arylsulfatase A-like enzyme